MLQLLSSVHVNKLHVKATYRADLLIVQLRK